MVEPTFSSPDAARAAATPMGSAPAPATAGQEVSLDVFAKDVAAATDQQRLALAQRLKDAGLWKGKISSKFDIKYYGALVKLEEQYQGQIALDKLVGSTVAVNRYDVLTGILADEGEGGDGGPTTTRQTYITSASQTAKLANDIAVNLLERDLSPAEQEKIKKVVNAAQRKQPSVQTSGKGFSTTQGGVDEQQLIKEEISKTAEAKTVRATDAYAIMMQEFGGLR
jgi:predicted RNA-binding protein with RPS1 domain